MRFSTRRLPFSRGVERRGEASTTVGKEGTEGAEEGWERRVCQRSVSRSSRCRGSSGSSSTALGLWVVVGGGKDEVDFVSP